jgi:group I intron endonuclease
MPSKSWSTWHGVYGVSCTANGRMLVGFSVDVVNRWQLHLYHLRRGTHTCRALQADWDEYGESSFKCSVLEECPRDKKVMRAAEQRWIETLKRAAAKPYNGPDRRGRPKQSHLPPRFVERLAVSPEHAERLKALHDQLDHERAQEAKAVESRKQQLLKRERRRPSRIGHIGADSDW